MVLNRLQVFDAAVPGVTGYKRWLQSPRQHLNQHFTKIVVFCLAFRFVAYPEIYWHMATCWVCVIEGDEVNPLDCPVVFSRPEMADQSHRIAIGFIKNSIIDTQCATNKTQGLSGLFEHVFWLIMFAVKKTINAIVRNTGHFCQPCAC